MSYIPDYRSEENEKHLSDRDRAYLLGYRHAVEDASNFFNNLDVYKVSKLEEDIIEKLEIKEAIEDWLDMGETEMVCSIFESADYIPEDIEIKDMNRERG